jgi:hypothetical protein
MTASHRFSPSSALPRNSDGTPRLIGWAARPARFLGSSAQVAQLPIELSFADLVRRELVEINCA